MPRVGRLIALVLAVSAAVVPGSASGLSQRSPAASPLVYWGAYVGGGQYGLTDAPWDMGAADRFEANAGKRMSLLEWGQDWYECSTSCGLRGFRADLMSKARARGYLPVLSWGSYREGGDENQPEFSLAEITGGRYDRFIRNWALGAKRWGHPFFLRFDWEMNTNGVPYSEHSNGNRRGAFVRMWRHVHDIFRQVGATNVTWVWCPNVFYPGSVVPLRSLYPGPAYVDWTCLDGYNFGTDPSHPATWTPFAAIFGPTYRLIANGIAPAKPLMIGETSSTEIGGSKADWIADAVGTQIPQSFPRVAAFVWFNKAQYGLDWPIESSPEATAAMHDALASPLYVTNLFRYTLGVPIRPLR